MENLIQLQSGSKGYGSKLLFNEASFAVNESEHVGVIGPNGAGKTTLFKILIGEETLDQGQLIKSRQLRLGYLSQHDRWKAGETIEEFISRDSVMPIWELKALGRSLGLEESHFERPIESFSGGYRMRAKLLALIGTCPNLMLLDEPTNYLDLETVLILEKFLQDYSGAFLLISHDREFLRRTTDHTLEVENTEITKYNGNIDDYFEQKELLRTQLQARAMSQEEKRKKILDFVSRFGAKATKARQAQSRLKVLEKMESIEIKPLPVGAQVKIPSPVRTGKQVLNLARIKLGYGDRTVLEDVDFRISSGEHVGVVGLNGAGKSTLLKAIAGKLEPMSGRIEYGYGVTVAFFGQHVAEDLLPEDTVWKSLEKKAHPEVLPQQILNLAGSLLFSGDDIHKPIRVLSGGEKSRVALGQVLLQKASCLVLDEPTNHLDFQTVEALTQSLQEFPGALVVVSHDRSFIRRVGTRILEIHHGKAGYYPGSYDEYVWSLEKGDYANLGSLPTQPPQARKESIENNGPTKDGGSFREKKKALEKQLRQLDTKMNQIHQKLEVLYQKIALLNDEVVAGKSPEKSAQEMGESQLQIDALEKDWMEAAEQKEVAQRAIEEL